MRMLFQQANSQAYTTQTETVQNILTRVLDRESIELLEQD